tara:strand:+ start:1657 stop:1908 length:252 start_codon:yes stop_codon:yes gene_type:complete
MVRPDPICNHHAERVCASPGSEDPGGMKAAVVAICKAPAQQGSVRQGSSTPGCVAAAFGTGKQARTSIIESERTVICIYGPPV